MASSGPDESGYAFWVVDQQTRVDTEQLLSANVSLREAAGTLDQAVEGVNSAVSSVQLTLAAGLDSRAVALADELQAAYQTLVLAQDLLVRLVFWRERAAQIYEVAEQSVTGFFSSCRVAEYADCGQDVASWRQQFSGVPWVGAVLSVVTATQALSTYQKVLNGDAPGVGAESLQMQIQTQQVAGSLNPWFERGKRLAGAAPVGDQGGARGQTGEAAGTMAGFFRLLRRKTGTDTHGVLVAGRIPGSSAPVFALAAVTSSDDPTGGGQTLLYSGPQDGKGWQKASATTAVVMGAAAAVMARAPCSAVTPLRGDQVLQQMEKNVSHGEIEIVKHSGPQGQSWSVLVRGTKEWSPFSENPHDLLTNFDEVAGSQSDQRQAVVAAMELAGIEPDDPVELVGHSQGGIVVANLAADPELEQRFHVVSVLTAGSPVGGTPPLGGDTRMLSLENLRDIVPGLDGRSNPQGQNNLTVYFDAVSDPRQPRVPPDGPGGAHDKSVYIDALGALEEGSAGKEVTDFFDYRRSALGIDDSTTSTALYFRTQRIP